VTERSDYNDNGDVISTSQWIKEPDVAERKLWDTETQYNKVGQVTKSRDRYGLWTETLYDKRGLEIEARTQTIATDQGTPTLHWMVSRTVYDLNGRVALVTDPYVVPGSCSLGDGCGVVAVGGSRNVYDGAGRVIRFERLASLQVAVENNGDDKTRATIALPGWTVVSWTETTYDNGGRVTGTVDSFGLKSFNRYNGVGQVVETRRQGKDAAGEVVWLISRTVFDEYGRVSFAGDAVVAVPCDAADCAALVSSGSATQYDDLGRAVKSFRLANS
jgi:hypothetical protein